MQSGNSRNNINEEMDSTESLDLTESESQEKMEPIFPGLDDLLGQDNQQEDKNEELSPNDFERMIFDFETPLPASSETDRLFPPENAINYPIDNANEKEGPIVDNKGPSFRGAPCLADLEIKGVNYYLYVLYPPYSRWQTIEETPKLKNSMGKYFLFTHDSVDKYGQDKTIKSFTYVSEGILEKVDTKGKQLGEDIKEKKYNLEQVKQGIIGDTMVRRKTLQKRKKDANKNKNKDKKVEEKGRYRKGKRKRLDVPSPSQSENENNNSNEEQSSDEQTRTSEQVKATIQPRRSSGFSKRFGTFARERTDEENNLPGNSNKPKSRRKINDSP